MSYIGKNPKADTLNLTPQSSLPTTPSEGMLWRSDGTVRGIGLFEYKSGNWIQVDEQLGDSDTLDLQTSDGCNLTYNANWYSSGSLNIQGRSDTWGAEREDLSGTGTNDFITLSTTAADLLNSNGVSVIKFAPTDATAGRNSYFGRRIDLQQGWRGSNLVVEFRYKTAETSGDTTDEDWLFVARDASLPPLEIASQGTNTLTPSAIANVYAEDGTTSIYQAPVVGDSIMLTDTSNNTYIRYITALSTAATVGATPVVTYSGTDLTLPTGTTVNATAMPGIFTSLTQYLPASDDQGSTYKAQVKTETDTKTIEYGIMHISTQTDQQIYVDNILLSANKFLQASSQTKAECYFAKKQNDFWDNSTGNGYLFNEALLLPQVGTPPLAQSKLLTIADGLLSDGTTSGSVITAKEDIVLSIASTAALSAGCGLHFYIIDGDEEIAGHSQPDGSTATNSVDVSATIKASKGERFYFLKQCGTRAGGLTVTATPQTSPVILLESQDEIFTDWNEFTMTPTSGTTVTKGTIVTDKAYWRRNGPNMEIMWDYKQSTTGASGTGVTNFPLPSGYVADTSKVYASSTNFLAQIGHVKAGFSATNGIGIYSAAGMVCLLDSTNMGLFFPAAYNNLTQQSATNFGFGGEAQLGFSMRVSIPIVGWNANFNPLLSMPLVDLGQPSETWFVTVTSTSNFWTTGGTGVQRQWDSALLKGPNADSSTAGNIADSNLISIETKTSGTNSVTAIVAKQDIVLNVSFSSYLNSSAEIILLNSDDQTLSAEQQFNSSNYISSVNVSVNLKSGDYIWAQSGDAYNNDGGCTITATKVQSGNMAHIIKPAVATLMDVRASTVAADSAGTGGFNNRKLNTIRGESWFVTLTGTGTTGTGGTNTDFTLDPGTYNIKAYAPTFNCNSNKIRLYDVTKDSNGNIGLYCYTDSNDDGSMIGFYQEVIHVTSSTEYRLQQWTDAAGTLGFGGGAGARSGLKIYTQVVIEKLK